MPARRRRMKGGAFWDDINGFLKDSGIISKALPFVGTALGTLADPFIGPAGTIGGTVLGSALSDFAKSKGYGKVPPSDLSTRLRLPPSELTIKSRVAPSDLATKLRVNDYRSFKGRGANGYTNFSPMGRSQPMSGAIITYGSMLK